MKTGKNMSKRIVKLLIGGLGMPAAHGMCEHGGAYRSFCNHSAGVYAAPRAYPKPYAGAGAGGGNGGSQQRIR